MGEAIAFVAALAFYLVVLAFTLGAWAVGFVTMVGWIIP